MIPYLTIKDDSLKMDYPIHFDNHFEIVKMGINYLFEYHFDDKNIQKSIILAPDYKHFICKLKKIKSKIKILGYLKISNKRVVFTPTPHRKNHPLSNHPLSLEYYDTPKNNTIHHAPLYKKDIFVIKKEDINTPYTFFTDSHSDIYVLDEEELECQKKELK